MFAPTPSYLTTSLRPGAVCPDGEAFPNLTDSAWFVPGASMGRAGARGFSLIELLAVISVIAVLAAIIFSAVGHIRQTAQTATCASNLRQLGGGMFLYVNDNSGRFPDSHNQPKSGVTWFWDACILSMLGDATESTRLSYSKELPPYSDILYCPADAYERDPAKADIPRSYSLNPVLINYVSGSAPPEFSGYGADSEPNKGMRIDSLINPARTAMLVEKHQTLNTYNSGSHFVGAGELATHGETVNILFCDGSVRNVEAPKTRSEAVANYLKN
ncbi:type II secretion system protein [Ruficoccus amylovorans]|uniref:Type II secretion system protein n=1 Tax=Ruficoccus amylovorans TaxID=1804625 RepID=A0A842HJ36_9BACT|nr:type II secretion system protein [Ruficoccus amylovorans]MBC2595988.1 type II secretion system protein [Ruficoccus amylovorans]